MRIYNTLTRKLFIPTIDFVNKGSLTSQLNKLEKSQWLSTEEIADLQTKKLRKLVNHSYRTVPYYHKLFRDLNLYPDDIKHISDLSKIPFLSKKVINDNYNSLCSRNKLQERWSIGSTGGTTGNTLTFRRSQRCIDFDWAAAYRSWGWGGYRIGDKYADFWSNPVGINKSNKPYGKALDFFRRRNLINCHNMDRNFLSEKVIPSLKKSKPKFLRGYASVLYVLAKIADPNQIRPDAVFTTAENLTNPMRDTIEKKFNCKVFDGYSAEGGAHANECDHHNGYHIHSEGVAMEFLDSEGEHVNDNERGETYFPKLNISSPCKKGSILIFPPLWPWLHGGAKPINKSKYIVGSYFFLLDKGFTH